MLARVATRTRLTAQHSGTSWDPTTEINPLRCAGPEEGHRLLRRVKKLPRIRGEGFTDACQRMQF